VSVETSIDTRPLGLAVAFNTEPKFWQAPEGELLQVVFDTGIILFAPRALAESMVFGLEEGEPPMEDGAEAVL